MHARYLKLCLVTNLKNQTFSEYRSLILQAVHGGVTSVQLRVKNNNKDEILALALEIKKLLRPFNIPLIINDHVDIAKAVSAEGVHIGPSDMSPQEARKILGPNAIIGLSLETFQELEIANQLSCIDYLAASKVFPSKTKPDGKTLWGLDDFYRITQISRHPVMAIGGVNVNNVASLIEKGACGVAVIGAIHDYDNPQKAASELIQIITTAEDRREESYSRYRL